ncbi:hypothetical protein EVAR_84300_1 [Eumeta japonica]|uniref:Uncharacterized protein n=1 Tax=Eumeta variegata TaxID=151549 RepID=A0A4C2A2K3_EUMVA|nr:hypothetical protein EVAR_84300_1 [Eumeta japonica]
MQAIYDYFIKIGSGMQLKDNKHTHRLIDVRRGCGLKDDTVIKRSTYTASKDFHVQAITVTLNANPTNSSRAQQVFCYLEIDVVRNSHEPFPIFEGQTTMRTTREYQIVNAAHRNPKRGISALPAFRKEQEIQWSGERADEEEVA